MNNMNPTIEQSNVPVSTIEGVTPVPTMEQEPTQPVVVLSEENVPQVLEKKLPDTRLQTDVTDGETYTTSAGHKIIVPPESRTPGDKFITAYAGKISNEAPLN